jgi:hypothetical protein
LFLDLAEQRRHGRAWRDVEVIKQRKTHPVSLISQLPFPFYPFCSAASAFWRSKRHKPNVKLREPVAWMVRKRHTVQSYILCCSPIVVMDDATEHRPLFPGVGNHALASLDPGAGDECTTLFSYHMFPEHSTPNELRIETVIRELGGEVSMLIITDDRGRHHATCGPASDLRGQPRTGGSCSWICSGA